MTTIADLLAAASFPEDYASILIETLAVIAAHLLGLRAALDRSRRARASEAEAAGIASDPAGPAGHDHH